MTSLNAKLREQGASAEAENIQQLALIKEQASRDMQVIQDVCARVRRESAGVGRK